jgi:hypothetical protein
VSGHQVGGAEGTSEGQGGGQRESPRAAATGLSSSTSDKAWSKSTMMQFSDAGLPPFPPLPAHPTPPGSGPDSDGSRKPMDTSSATTDYLGQARDLLAGFGDTFDFDFLPTPAFFFDTSSSLSPLSPPAMTTESGGVATRPEASNRALLAGEADAFTLPHQTTSLFSFDLPDGFFVPPPSTGAWDPAIPITTSKADSHNIARSLY